MFGLGLTKLNNIAPFASKVDDNPIEINNTYLQLPPTIDDYIQNKLFFQADYNNLKTLIFDTDNAAQIALKVKQYLEDIFVFNLNASQNNPPGENEDQVDWFCKYKEGVWSDFASAFVVFTRAFGVASRFISGFNTRDTGELFDNERFKNAVPIRYRNMYNWAEVYIPTSDYTGEWIQVDVCDFIDLNQSASGYNLTLTSDYTSGYRDEGKWATMTATLTHPNSSVTNRPINFRDEYMNEHIGTVLTDINGNATISVEINNTQTIGPHIISASFSLYAYNFTNIQYLNMIQQMILT